jgi:DNA-binding response OmpR family regulator
MSISRPLGILLVDDEPDLREALAQMLAFLGHTVTCAETGEQALVLFGEGTGYDLVVTDLSMPGMGGVGLVGALRSKCKELPIIVFSGLDENVARGLTAKLSNIHFLKKPFTFQSMTAAIAQSSPVREAGPDLA